MATLDAWYANLGETTHEALMRLNARYSGTGEIRDAMEAFFGPPARCLVCARPLKWSVLDGVDPWFCMEHCPVCRENEAMACPLGPVAPSGFVVGGQDEL